MLMLESARKRKKHAYNDEQGTPCQRYVSHSQCLVNTKITVSWIQPKLAYLVVAITYIIWILQDSLVMSLFVGHHDHHGPQSVAVNTMCWRTISGCAVQLAVISWLLWVNDIQMNIHLTSYCSHTTNKSAIDTQQEYRYISSNTNHYVRRYPSTSYLA